MPSKDSQVLDRQLAELRRALKRVHTPERVRENIETTFEGRLRRSIDPLRIYSFWWVPAGLAAALLIASLSLNWQELSAERETTVPADERTEFLIIPTQLPVLMHSVTTGAEVVYLDAQVVTDKLGTENAIYIAQPWQEYKP